VRTFAMNATTIAEIYVDRGALAIDLEIGMSDLAAFANVLPDELFFRDNAGIQVAGVEIDGPVFRHDQPRPLFNGSYMGGYHGFQEGTEGSRGDYAAHPGRRIVRPVPGRRQRGGW